jgi:MOSC domain-containing protein YiiM
LVEINSQSTGDPALFRELADLEAALLALPPSPRDQGRVSLVVVRGDNGRRQTPDRVRLTVHGGLEGDSWGREQHGGVDAQLAVMQHHVALLLANGQPLALSGDSLFLDLDLSAENLPIGTRLRVGTALLEVTPKAHNGCKKFRSRFGAPALRFVNQASLRHRNLRGIYMQVLQAGETGPGDVVEVVDRGKRQLDLPTP